MKNVAHGETQSLAEPAGNGEKYMRDCLEGLPNERG